MLMKRRESLGRPGAEDGRADVWQAGGALPLPIVSDQSTPIAAVCMTQKQSISGVGVIGPFKQAHYTVYTLGDRMAERGSERANMGMWLWE